MKKIIFVLLLLPSCTKPKDSQPIVPSTEGRISFGATKDSVSYHNTGMYYLAVDTSIHFNSPMKQTFYYGGGCFNGGGGTESQDGQEHYAYAGCENDEAVLNCQKFALKVGTWYYVVISAKATGSNGNFPTGLQCTGDTLLKPTKFIVTPNSCETVQIN